MWQGKIICDLCSIDTNEMKKMKMKYFYDCKTIYGVWALLCSDCFKKYGLNMGKRYSLNKNETTSLTWDEKGE